MCVSRGVVVVGGCFLICMVVTAVGISQTKDYRAPFLRGEVSLFLDLVLLSAVEDRRCLPEAALEGLLLVKALLLESKASEPLKGSPLLKGSKGSPPSPPPPFFPLKKLLELSAKALSVSPNEKGNPLSSVLFTSPEVNDLCQSSLAKASWSVL